MRSSAGDGSPWPGRLAGPSPQTLDENVELGVVVAQALDGGMEPRRVRGHLLWEPVR